MKINFKNLIAALCIAATAHVSTAAQDSAAPEKATKQRPPRNSQPVVTTDAKALAASDSEIPNFEETRPAPIFVELFNGTDLSGWVDVNTSPTTWSVNDENLLVCQGQPIGVMRSERMYENFVLVVEWRHMESGGNSGVFLWCDAKPQRTRLPMGMEVQMLELEWPFLHAQKDGTPRPLAYVHGELFGAGGMTATPANPRGTRSQSLENRCLGKGQWNRYVIVAVDGTVKLSVNGKFVNSIRNASFRKGYICLESEGAEIHFRKISLMELPGGFANPTNTVPVVQ
ncbi:MAG: DUF1080 domain-containing protein [Planctomycetaceae bacterium]|nr:DUF1080 domain-containing protein [Planctomycetaceae bacterium]